MRAIRRAVMSIALALVFLFMIGVLPFSSGTSSFGEALAAPNVSPMLHVRKGRMDAVIQGATMRRVMREVSRQTGINIFVEKSLLDSPLFVRFTDLSIEEGLKRIAGNNSYAMIFDVSLDAAGNHPVKAIRLYPKGKPETGRYVLLHSTDHPEREGVKEIELSREQVEAMLAMNDKITRSNIARRITEQKNGKEVGSAPGKRTRIEESIYRAKQARYYKELKARTLARRNMVEEKRNFRLHQEAYLRGRLEFEHRRQEGLKAERMKGLH